MPLPGAVSNPARLLELLRHLQVTAIFPRGHPRRKRMLRTHFSWPLETGKRAMGRLRPVWRSVMNNGLWTATRLRKEADAPADHPLDACSTLLRLYPTRCVLLPRLTVSRLRELLERHSRWAPARTGHLS